MSADREAAIREALLAAQGILDALPSMFRGEAWAEARSKVIQAYGLAEETEAELAAAREREEKLREALRWYADPATYVSGSYGSRPAFPPIDKDRGSKARAALSEGEGR